MVRILLGLLILKIISLHAFETIGGLHFLCLEDWEQKFGNCYLFVDVANSQKMAANVCKSYGSELANPKDDKEFHYLKAIAESKFLNQSKFWIGYSKEEDNECHGYWDNFQPNWTEGNCVAMKNDNGLYVVDKCNRTYSFVCQKEGCVQSYPCNNGKCVLFMFVMDGQNDCGDNSDEKENIKRCNNVYRTPTGKFTSDPAKVTANHNCIITIEAPIGSRIIVEFELDKSKMDNQYLEIWSGGSDVSEHSLIGRPIHSNTNKFYSKNNFVFVKYYTTGNVTKEIFSFNWTSEAIHSKTLQAQSGPQKLKIPDGSMLFPNLQLSWKIEAPKGSIITVRLTELILRNSKGNSLEIWYKDVMAVNLTHSTENQVFISNTNEVYIYLNSGNEVCKGGFTLFYQEGCEITLDTHFGQISSPGFNTIDPTSGLYVTNMKCSWNIVVPDVSRFVTLVFGSFNLTDPNDFVEVYNNNVAMKNLTGTNSIDNLDTTRVEFTSSHMDVSSGFNATFSMSCEDIQSVVSAETIVTSSNTFMTTANTSCKPGHVFKQEEYTKTKTQSLVCNARGVWSKRIPSCEIITCETFSHIENGLISFVSGIIYGSYVNYTCNKGYSQTVNYATCDESGNWTGVPICQPGNCSSSLSVQPNSKFEQVLGNDTEVGSIKKAVCDPGYKLEGEDRFICLPDKTWSTNTYNCAEKDCWIPYNYKISNSEIVVKHNQDSNYKCLGDCTMNGTVSVTLTCSKGDLKTADGTKFTDLNTCEGTDCYEPVNTCDECTDYTDNCKNTTDGKPICVCDYEHKGKTCKSKLDACGSDPCQNGGTCQNQGGSIACFCKNGMDGNYCEKNIGKCYTRPCQNGAKCYYYADDYFCRCPKGFSSKNCDTRWNVCKFGNMCMNGGTCDVTGCNCKKGFTGTWCQLEKDFCDPNPCKASEICWSGNDAHVCITRTDYFPCTDESEMCKTIPCPVMKKISECQSCKSSSEDFDIFFESTASGGATLSHYAQFDTNEFSVCMKLLFSAQKNSDGTFITLLKENAMNTFDEYLAIGSKGITLNSTDYTYSVELNYKDFSSICVAINKEGNTIILVREFQKTGLKMSPLELTNEKFKIVIGQNFYGYITKLNIFNKALTYEQFINLPDPPYINWANYVPSWGAKFRVPSADPITNICDFEVDSSKCPSKPDKILPKFINCNTNDVNVVCPRLTCSINITQPEANEGTIRSTINPHGTVDNWGSENVIFEARDKLQNSATCRLKLFVKYKNTCEDPPDFSQSDCNIVCPAGEALCMPFPFKISCSKLGVFNRTHPFHDMLIPPCGDQEPYSVEIHVFFRYIISSGISCKKPEVLTSVVDEVKSVTDGFITAYTGFCHGSCSNVQYNTSCDGTSDINMTVIIPYTTTTIKRNNDSVKVSTSEVIERLVWIQNVYKKIEKKTLGTLVTDSIKVTTIPGCLFGYGFVSNKCVQCGLGTYYDESTLSCHYCPIGHYQNQRGQASCEQCPNNETTAAVGVQKLGDCHKNCSLGFYFDEKNCAPCNIGFYQDEEGQKMCKPCPLGKTTYANQSNSESLCFKICQPGYQLNITGSCEECPRGFYRQFDYQPSCISCAVNTTTLDAGSILPDNCSIPACRQGEFLNGSICNACPDGKYQDKIWQDSCTSCPSGTWTRGNGKRENSSCEAYCDSGEEKVNATDSCSKCQKGYFRDLQLLDPFALCTKCPENFTTVGEGETNCSLRICPEGTFIKNDTCTPCLNNTYQPAMSKYSCEECPNNTYTLSEGSIKISDCKLICPAGYEGYENCTLCEVDYFKEIKGAEDCSKCPPHFLANADRTVCNVLNCEAGYYNETASSCLPCEKGKYKDSVGNSQCTSCPNSNYTTKTTGSTSANNCTEVDCLPGYKFDRSVNMCIVCPKGTYQTKRGDHSCILCTGIFTTPGNASTSENECVIPNCPAGEEPTQYFKSCTNCSLGYYKNNANTIMCIKCPVNKTTSEIGATDLSQCSQETAQNPNVLSTVDIVIVLQYSLPDCENKRAFYKQEIKTSIEKRMNEMTQDWNLCTGDCEVKVNINCPTSKRKKRATSNGEAEIRIENVKPDTKSKITNQMTKTESVFTQDCKVNPDQYNVDSAQLIGCAVTTSCKYSQLVSTECVKCPAGTKATLTGCVDCPGGTYSAIDQRNCTNCTFPLTSKPRSNSSGCLAECLVEPTYCKNGGLCSRGVNDRYHLCFCLNKFSGTQCETFTGPVDPKQTWIFVGIGCLAAILVIILILAGIIINLRKKPEKEKKQESTFDEEPVANFAYGYPMQGYMEKRPFATEWHDLKKF